MACTLCGLTLPARPIMDQEAYFCCHGCHAVFQILSAKNALTNFQEDPLFKQALQAGLISNPALLQQLKEKQENIAGVPTKKLHLEIGNMWCPSCAELIRIILLRTKGVAQCTVDYATDLASIEYSPILISKERIIKLIISTGYIPYSLDAPERTAVSSALYFRFIIAAFCALNVMMFAYPLYATYFDFDGEGYGSLFAWLSLIFSLPVVTYCAWPIFRRAWAAMFHKILGMEALVAIGVLAAFIFSVNELMQEGTQVYFDSMTLVIVFVLLGKIIESKAKFSAKATLIRLNKGLPKKGRKKINESDWQYVLTKDIIPGDILQTRMGEKIVLDGIVIKGCGTCDESLMTGEALPVVKEVGERVMAGSILQHGYLEIEVLATSEKSALHAIIQMVEKDIGHKSAYVRAVDPWVKAFVPAVLVFASAVFFAYLSLGLETAIVRMMAVLLISCPCAIGIAAPLAESHLLHALTKLGVIIRNRGVLQNLGRETAYVFDKTGTITKGVFQVVSGLSSLSREGCDVLREMTAHSMHPIARAISGAVKGCPVELSNFEEIVGKGIKASYQGRSYFLGSRLFMLQKGFVCGVSDSEHTTVWFGCDKDILSQLILDDQIRCEAVETVRSLSSMRTILLSGDAASAVEKVASTCSFKEWYSETSPLEKRELIEKLKREGYIVCFIGDGINDAPALTAAHIGVSVLSASDISIQISDILLTTDRLTLLPQVRQLSQKAHRIIMQNLFWAFIYNVIGIFLAAWGWLSPIFAAGAMVASSLIVLFNAQRLSGRALTSLTDPAGSGLVKNLDENKCTH